MPGIVRTAVNKLPTTYLTLLLLLLLGCNDEVDYGIGEYRVDLVKVISGSEFSLLNNDETLLRSSNSLRSYKEGDRILLNYSYSESGNFVKINTATTVFCDTIIDLSKVKNIGNDALTLENCWLGLNYLNITCSFDYYKEKARVALILERTSIDNKTCYLSFRYDKNEDTSGSLRRLYASFDLEELLGKPKGEKKIIVSFNASNYEKDKCSFEFEY